MDTRQSTILPTLLMTCPICTQGLALRTHGSRRRLTCPRCGAPIAVRPRRLFDDEILTIVSPMSRQ